MLGSLPILPLPAPPTDFGPLPAAQVQNDADDEHMQEAEDDQKRFNSTPASIATHTRTKGIIRPPPDIRSIVDKAASFVAKNGPDLERIIIANSSGNPKFNFLNCSDPYHAYYQHQLSEFRAQNHAPGQQSTQQLNTPVPQSTPSAATTDGNDTTEQTNATVKFRPVRKNLDPPEAEQFTICLPEGIMGEELDIVKLTAQFVARNGKSFLIGLTSRENNNPQFHFLKPTHSMFMFFTSLADAYSKVLMPPKALTDNLKKCVTDMTTVLERCLNRLEWEQSQEQARQKAEDEIEQERLLMSMIDWHDFVVVESVDFADDEDNDLPPPITLEVITRSRMPIMEEEEIVEPEKEVEMEMDEEEVQVVQEGMQEGMQAASLDENSDDTKKESMAISDENEPQMRIVKNWKRPEDRVLAERNPNKYVVSPITGEYTSVNEMSEHMRISLIDPKYKEQKERTFAKIRETTLAQDDEISKNIVGLARTRPDIFGTTEEEVSNAVKAEMEKKDGHTGSIGQTATQAIVPPPPRPGINPMVTQLCPQPPPMQMSYGHQTYLMNRPPPQMGQCMSMNPPSIPVPLPPGSQFTSLAPPRPFIPQHGMPMAPPPPMSLGMPPPPTPEEAPPPLPEEPKSKKQRLDDSSLVPEDQFLAQHPGPVRITVTVPNMDEGNLKGQLLEITVQSLSESINSLKEKIAGEIQVPVNKQKLSGKLGLFMKDQVSLAFYNVGGGEMLSLSLRERGGRRR